MARRRARADHVADDPRAQRRLSQRRRLSHAARRATSKRSRCANRWSRRPADGVVYSDLGFIALGVVLARNCGTGARNRRSNASCARSARERATYRVAARERAHVPATERDAWRGLVQGRVHDEKAHLTGGVAGHAGLFADARDVARLGEWYLGRAARPPLAARPRLARDGRAARRPSIRSCAAAWAGR